LARNDDYYLYKDGEKNDVYVKMPDGKTDYEGWCWSGSASWIDNLNPAFWSWWVTQFNLAGKKLKANARNMHFWLDMNEPAIFNGPEVTAPKDVKHYGGWEHRDIHNIYSVAYHNASSNAVKLRETPHHRPFTLARGWWIGTWKAGAIWTGDNLGTWEHLAVSLPMILANNIGGMSFCGADVGGFFGNPSPDFLVRWYQAGIFQPFFRAHAHIDTKRREPYLLEEPLKSAVRDLIKLRYKMLPMWYSAFKESSHGGLPVLRPQFLMFPNDASGYAIDDQYYIGDSGLLVHPAVKDEITSVEVYLAEEQPYYNYFTHAVYYGSSSGKRVSVPAPLTGQVPLLHRGGSILPLRERVRRAAELGWKDPFTLVIALNKPFASPSSSSRGGSLRATGKLYMDDGDTYNHETGDFIWKRFEWHTDASNKKKHSLHSVDEATISTSSQVSTSVKAKSNGVFVKSIADVRIEKLVILGLEDAPKAIKVIGSDEPLQFTWTSGVSASGSLLGGKASKLVVKDPRVKVVQDWNITFE
jgi:alpha 1,3-glucosidase